jgi:hypothetical protein
MKGDAMSSGEYAGTTSDRPPHRPGLAVSIAGRGQDGADSEQEPLGWAAARV